MIPGRIRAAGAALFVSLALPAAAQQPPQQDAILVLDASGSMWAQIDGKPRIEIAREVISGLLDDLPANRRLGLVAYGHNRKGDCKDIETLVDVGTDREAIRGAIREINPRGKTPMTAAVRQAAEALKYSEDPATVILVSDGIETCGLDPCAVAGTLEETGVALTVHTVGFGLGAGEQAAKAQLQCMADKTGGRFLQANDAEELAEALQEVSASASASASAPAPEPEPEPEPKPAPAVTKVENTLVATDQDRGPVIKDGLLWTVRHGATGEVIFESAQDAGTVKAEIPRGVHDVSVTRVSDGATAEGTIETGTNGSRLVLPIVVELLASVKAPTSAPAGSEVRVSWTGPDEKSDYIAVAAPGAKASSEINFAYTKAGNPLHVKLPDAVGNYEIRYISRKTRDILARQTIEATTVEATLEVPATAAAGSTIQVTWSGPDYEKDYLAVAEPDAKGSSEISYAYTRDGSPSQLKLPDQPGTYEVRYILHQSRSILARQAIEVTPVQATLEVPATAAAGSTIRVTWSGPDYEKDYLAVAEPDAKGSSEITYAYTKAGSPLNLKLPDKPGTYEVRYILHQSRGILARETIEIR